MLTCQNLFLKNNEQTIFTGCSFTILPGSLLIIQGPNGSGKTCLLKMITGRLNRNKSNISWNSINIWRDIHAFQSNISYIGHKNALKLSLSVIDNLKFWCKLRGIKQLLAPAIAYFQLGNILDVEIGNLSAGWQRRVELAKLMITNTHLWLLDEPEVNLDHEAKDRFLNLVKIKTQEGGIVLIASHSFNSIPFANYINLRDFQDESMVTYSR